MEHQKTLVIFKPGVAERGLIGTILARFEAKHLSILAAKVLQFSKEHADSHYHEHVSKPFYPELEHYICSAPVLILVLGGLDAIATVRRLAGATKVEDALPGTIRGDFAVTTMENIIHASDSPQSAKEEIQRFFSESEIIQ